VSGKRALITGISGQDGSYLAELLLSKGYEVHGVVRHASTHTSERLAEIDDRLTLHTGDLLDQRSLTTAIAASEPDEVYNLAAMSLVSASWVQPTLTAEITGLGVIRVLEAMREAAPEARFYQASSSEMFGQAAETPQRETTQFHPRSPYGVAKAFGHHATINYRESYGIHASSGILFNHESPRRGLEFVTRRVTYNAAAIKLGIKDKLTLGNLDARRDWGYAGDYVEAMWLMLQQDEPGDYVVGTGVNHSVADLVRLAFGHLGLDPDRYIEQDPDLLRPAEVDQLSADASRARSELGWEPSTSFEELVSLMVEADLELLEGKVGTPPATRA
jgi:GDPmannose 4,6-dehydratase